MAKRSKESAAAFINIDRSVNPVELRERLADRDRRQASDTRTDVQKFLGDPPPLQCAKAQASQQAPRRIAERGQRVDLWKK